VSLVTGPAEGPEGELLEEARSQGLQVTVVPELRREIGLLADWRAYRALRSLIREERPAIVHTHSSKAGFLGRMAASAERTPVVIHTIHGLPFHPYERWWRNRLYVAAERMAARRSDRLICVAEAMRRQALAAGVGRPEQYRVVYSGMDVEAFGSDTLDGAAVRRGLGFGEDDVVIGKIARLFEFKGHEDVLRAFAQVAEGMPSARLLLVGDGILRAQLERLAESLGISGRVAFAGLVPASRIPEMLAAMDLVVHASYREGLARVLPQALISRLPVVSYDVDGAPEVVIPGRTGVLVRPGDIEGLAEAMSLLAQDPELRSRMGEEGRRLFCKRFSREVMVNEISAIYESCLAEKNVPAP
jgi:glycosyltransferase involved in cell wall biosynthesis